MKVDANTCYLPNAAKLQPMGFSVAETDAFGRRTYLHEEAMIAVDDGASGEVTIWTCWADKSVGRRFTGRLLSEAFFHDLLDSLGLDHLPRP